MTTEVETSRQEPSLELDLDALIRDLDTGWDHLPEQALRRCQAHAELVTPRLIATIEETVRLGREGKVRAGSAHVFALLLLTEFQARQALPVVLEVMALSDPVIDELYGDLITEEFPRVLAVLADDHPDLIESMVSSVELNEFVRWGAASSLCMLVRDKKLTRAEAIERLARQLRAAIAAKDEWGTTITVCELGDLNPLEVQDEIETAFEQELVDETMIDWAYFKDDLLHPDQPGEAPDLPRQRPSFISDTVEELRTWRCFTEKPVAPLLPQRGADSISFDRDNDDWDMPAPLPPGHAETIRHDVRRVGRNDPCPCGSGKKYKKCCMKSGD